MLIRPSLTPPSPPALTGTLRRPRFFSPQTTELRQLTRTLIRCGVYQHVPEVLTFRDALYLTAGEVCSTRDLSVSIRLHGARFRGSWTYQGALETLNLQTLARRAVRARPGLLWALLGAAEEISRRALPLLTPDAALSGLHGVVYEAHEEFLDLDPGSSREQVILALHGQGMHAVEDAPRLYDTRAARPHGPAARGDHRQLQAALNPQGLPRGLAALSGQLAALLERAAPHLQAVDTLGEEEEICFTCSGYAVTSKRGQHLGDLADQLDGYSTESAVHRVSFPLTPRGGQAWRRVQRAQDALSVLAWDARQLLVGA